MLPSDLKYVFYILSPRFLYSALVLILLLLFALASLLMDTMSYSKIAVTHMLIFIFSTFCIPTVPISVSVDILLFTFIVISVAKSAGKLLSELGRSKYVLEKIIKLFLAFVCLAILQEVVFTKADFGWSAMGQSSVVVGALRRVVVDVGVEYSVVAELLVMTYWVAFLGLLLWGLWGGEVDLGAIVSIRTIWKEGYSALGEKFEAGFGGIVERTKEKHSTSHVI